MKAIINPFAAYDRQRLAQKKATPGQAPIHILNCTPDRQLTYKQIPHMKKRTEEIEFNVADSDEAIKIVKAIPGVYKVYMITCTRIKVFFNPQKVQANIIVKRAVPHDKRKKNYPTDNKKAA